MGGTRKLGLGLGSSVVQNRHIDRTRAQFHETFDRIKLQSSIYKDTEILQGVTGNHRLGLAVRSSYKMGTEFREACIWQ